MNYVNCFKGPPQDNIELEPGTTGLAVAGIVRVYHNNQWGTVCDYNGYWDMNDAKVACRQLGFTKAVGYWRYGRGSGKVWLYNMQCTGTETSLHSCTHNGWGKVASYCNSNKYDAGVILTFKCLCTACIPKRFSVINNRHIAY